MQQDALLDFRALDAAPPQLRMGETTSEFLKSVGIEPSADLSAAAAPAPQMSIRGQMTAVKNQGNLPACTAFCTLSLLEFISKKDLSESHLVHGAEKKCGDCKDAFNQFACAMSYARDLGVCEEAYWPYDDRKTCWASPPNIAGKPLFKFSSVSTLFTRGRSEALGELQALLDDGGGLDEAAVPGGGKTAALKAHLSQRKTPVGLEVPVYWAAGWKAGPDIKMPSRADAEAFLAQSTPTVDGWHCVAICGYDDSRSRFEFKNSWGTAWGNSGYGTLPYGYVDKLSASAMIAS